MLKNIDKKLTKKISIFNLLCCMSCASYTKHWHSWVELHIRNTDTHELNFIYETQTHMSWISYTKYRHTWVELHIQKLTHMSWTSFTKQWHTWVELHIRKTDTHELNFIHETQIYTWVEFHVWNNDKHMSWTSLYETLASKSLQAHHQ